MIARTESGSVYEIDAVGKRARRLAGKPTEMTADGWRDLVMVPVVDVGLPLVLQWDEPPHDFPFATGRATLTSRVVEVTP